MPICSKCGQGYEEVEFHRCQRRSPTFIFRLNSPWLLTIATLVAVIILDLVRFKEVGLTSLIAMQLILLVLIIWSMVWAYTDAQLRNKPGCAVALFIFLFWPISILIWIIFRPD